MLDRVEALANETPPVDNAASRFGNPAFKTFYDKVQQVRDNFLCSPPVSRGTRADERGLTASAAARLLRNSTSRSLSNIKTQSPRCPATFASRGETGRALTMGVGWSSIFFAGCVYHDSYYSVPLPDAPHAC